MIPSGRLRRDVVQAFVSISTLLGSLFAVWMGQASAAQAAAVVVHPAPAGEPLSEDFTLTVEGRDVPVYIAKVAPAEAARRWQAMDDKVRSADFFETASFATFDMEGAVAVTVLCPQTVRSAKVLPAAAGIPAQVEGRTVRFTLRQPRPVTLEINGSWVRALHLFANPPETGRPEPGGTNVVYFGPGIHEVTHLVVTNNQTVYLAGGAVVRGVIGPEEPSRISSYSGLRTYSPTFELRGSNITFRGHVQDVAFRNIRAQADPLRIELKGFDAEHRVERILFENVAVNGRPLSASDIQTNAFVSGVRVTGSVPGY